MLKNKSKILKNLIVVFLTAALVLTFSGCGLFGVSQEPAVYISQSRIEVEKGKSVKLQAVSSDDKVISWVSESEEVATVDGEGTVTGVSAGESLITAVSSSAMASCTIVVKEKQAEPEDPDKPDVPDVPDVPPEPEKPADPEIFTLYLDSVKLTVGETVTFKAVSSLGSAVAWSSSNTSVAVVNNGLVTARTAGVAVITASTGKVSAKCTVTVVDKPPVGGDEGDNDEDASKDGYNLVWRDEFNGNALDESKWGYQLGTQDSYGNSNGPAYWGNNELQYYTKDAVAVENGALKITASRKQTGDRPYSSGRIVTRDKASWTFGYFEAKMKTPTGNGMWPAFWMLPQPPSPTSSDNEYGGLPLNGEIDIMEAKGRLGNVVDNTLHFGSLWPNNRYLTHAATMPTNTEEWHVYAVEWTKDYIAWFVDGKETFKITSDQWYTDGSSAQSAPFDKPFYILLNLAVGGNYDGGIQPGADFTSRSMYVDYVRVYEKIV